MCVVWNGRQVVVANGVFAPLQTFVYLVSMGLIRGARLDAAARSVANSLWYVSRGGFGGGGGAQTDDVGVVLVIIGYDWLGM